MKSNNLFYTRETKIEKIKKYDVSSEKEVQNYFEKHLKNIINADFIATEYEIEKGRMDTLAIDEDNRPVIIEYKKNKAGSAVLQALFYKNWILTNKRQFILEVKNKFDEERASNIEWNIRLIIVAQEFDEWTINSTLALPEVELFAFSFYQNMEILNLEYIKRQNKPNKNNEKINIDEYELSQKREIDVENDEYYISKGGRKEDTNLGIYIKSSQTVKDMFDVINDYILSMDENVNIYKSRLYWSFKKERKFVEILFLKNSINIQLFLKHKPKDIEYYEWKGHVGHWGTLHHQFKIKNLSAFEEIKKYINLSFKNVQEI